MVVAMSAVVLARRADHAGLTVLGGYMWMPSA